MTTVASCSSGVLRRSRGPGRGRMRLEDGRGREGGEEGMEETNKVSTLYCHSSSSREDDGNQNSPVGYSYTYQN